MLRLLDINPALDRQALARSFETGRRAQVRDVLTQDSARNLRAILAEQTPWGLALCTGGKPENIRNEQVASLAKPQLLERQQALFAAAGRGDYAFLFSQYPMLDAYLEGWNRGGAHDAIMELINDEPFLDLVREITGIAGLVKADAQATLYGPGQFLSLHNDSHVGEGWRIAYVLNLCAVEWRPDWGGYLNFFDADGDVEQGFRPRFNALNLFEVPQPHNVSYVPPFAPPLARLAITGWFRDR